MRITLILFFICASFLASAQTYLYFQDSPDNEFYDYSWMELTAPSELERKGAELRRFPVESVVPPQQGLNSLRLKWRSVEGGSWVAIAAGDSWTAKDITDTDSLEFWLQSIEGIASANLPNVFMEDISNRKSIFLPLADYHGDLSAGEHERHFNGEELPSGVYVYRLEADGHTLTRSMHLLK